MKIDKIVDSWLEARPMVFKVKGAQLISATNNAAGRKHLELWLANHRQYHGGLRALMRRDGKEYFYKK